MGLDRALLRLINSTWSSSFLDVAMPVISNLENFIPFLAGLVLWMIFRDGVRGRVTVICLILLVPVTDQISSHVLKPAFHRPRPCRPEAGNEWVVARARCSGRGAFPSSHATNIAGVALLLGWRYRRWAISAALAALMVGYSRVYLGVHYPSDVLGGWILGGLLGAGIAWGGAVLERRWRARRGRD